MLILKIIKVILIIISISLIGVGFFYPFCWAAKTGDEILKRNSKHDYDEED
jgi:hypothetical protein